MADMTVDVDGIQSTLRAFRILPKEASTALRDRSMDLAGDMAKAVSSAARREGRQAALFAGMVKARKDRLPTVAAGGAKRVGRNRVPAWKVIFGSEFGSNRLAQFRPHNGRRGWWMFPTVEREAPMIEEAWNKVADDIVETFVRESGGED